MSWLEVEDDDEEDDDYQLLEEVSEYWRRGPAAASHRVYKVGGQTASLSPLYPGLVSDHCPEPGFLSSSRHKTKLVRDSDRRSFRHEEVSEVERLPNSKERQECTSRSPKQRLLPTGLFEEFSKDQFPFDWSKKTSAGLGGSKVLSSDMKRNDRDVRVPTMAQTNGIQGCKAKSLQHLFKETTYAASELHTLSPKTHNGLCCPISFPCDEKLQNYHNPLHGASAAFIQRLTEIAGLECDTIRQERIRKLKKRSDC
ncbi:uncharacterized protein LOC116972034 [Amblyraja radiata]|uniref:uncharacterized protein LOC116972034 n=1 Tax=Amblyraja radiata TaxID=386614 RepID=UPI001402B708|nr:uncharacterized protein LOC116972034 [Amblyraja radiata]